MFWILWLCNIPTKSKCSATNDHGHLKNSLNNQGWNKSERRFHGLTNSHSFPLEPRHWFCRCISCEGKFHNSNPCSHFSHSHHKTTMGFNMSHLWWYKKQHCRMNILELSWNIYIQYQWNDFLPEPQVWGLPVKWQHSHWYKSIKLCCLD